MTHITFIVITSAACLLTYLLHCINTKTPPTLHKIIQAVLIGPPLAGGITCVYLGLSGKLLFDATLEHYRLYFFAAGAALIWIGITALLNTIKP